MPAEEQSLATDRVCGTDRWGPRTNGRRRRREDCSKAYQPGRQAGASAREATAATAQGARRERRPRRCRRRSARSGTQLSSHHVTRSDSETVIRETASGSERTRCQDAVPRESREPRRVTVPARTLVWNWNQSSHFSHTDHRSSPCLCTASRTRCTGSSPNLSSPRPASLPRSPCSRRSSSFSRRSQAFA